MDIKFFHKEENAEPQEVGIASDVKFTMHGISPVTSFMGNGQQVMIVPNQHGQQVEVYMQGWKTPQDDFGVRIPTFSRRALLDREVQTYQATIAALTHMLGGAVTISIAEMDEAVGMTMEAEETKGPHHYITLRVKGKS